MKHRFLRKAVALMLSALMLTSLAGVFPSNAIDYDSLLGENAEFSLEPTLDIQDYMYSFGYNPKLNEKLVALNSDGDYLLIDADGTYVTLEFDEVSYYDFDKFITVGTRIGNDILWGAIDFDLNSIIPCEYEEISYTNYGIIVKKDGKYGLLAENGDVKFPCIYEEHFIYNSGVILVTVLNGKYGIINQKGETLLPFEYESIEIYNEKLAVCQKDGQFGVISLATGETVVDFTNRKLTLGYEDELYIEENGKIGVADFDGNIIIPAQYDDIYNIDEDNYAVNSEGKWGFYYTNGVQVPCIYSEYMSTYSGMVTVTDSESGKWGAINTDGNVIIPLIYDKPLLFYYDSAVACKHGKLGLIGSDNSLLCDFVYSDSATSNLPIVRFTDSNNMQGLVSLNDGSVIIPFEYDFIDLYTLNDIHSAMKDNKYGAINLNNEVVVPFEYDALYGTQFAVFVSINDGKYGLVDLNGNVLLPTEYDDIYTPSDGIITEKNGKKGLYQYETGTIIKCEFDKIEQFCFDTWLVQYQGKYGIIRYNWQNPFNDVSAESWFYDAIRWGNRTGCVNGVSPETFSPTEMTTRAMVTTLIGRMLGIFDSDYPADKPFPDVETNMYYSAHIAWASENGIVNGYDDGTFCPNKQVTRQELVQLFYNYLKYMYGATSFNISDDKLNTFADCADVAEWAKEAMSWAINYRAINGSLDNGVLMLNPQRTATRAEVTQLIYNLERKFF